MKTYLIALKSITYAYKARSLLKDNGYYCEIQRTPENLAKGCGYSIRIKGNLKNIYALLDSIGIKYKESMEYNNVG